MKILMILLSIFCTNCLRTSYKKIDEVYLTTDQVKQEFLSPKIMANFKDDEYRDRRSNLVPIKTLGAGTENLIPKLNFQTSPQAKPSVDLRSWDSPIKSQWNGTCTTFSGVAAIENRARKKLDLSERDSWNMYKQYSAAAFINALSKNKICDEKNWPQDREKPYFSCSTNRHAKILRSTYLAKNTWNAVHALELGNPIYIGMTTPEDMVACRKAIRHETLLSDGGHALLISGYQLDKDIAGGGYFILKNSWGQYCGDKGYQYLPFSYCQRSDVYCYMWSIDSVES